MTVSSSKPDQNAPSSSETSPHSAMPAKPRSSRAQTALQGQQQLRARLEQDLADTGKRLHAAEKARDAAIATLEQAATRGTTPRRKAS